MASTPTKDATRRPSGTDGLLSTPGGAPIRASTPLEHQVAGHAGVMEDESGDLVIKPALAQEIEFYQRVNGEPRSSPLGALRRFLPKFYGTLTLQGLAGEDGAVEEVEEQGSESVVLENLAGPFTSPCVMDIKLGTVLHGPDATPEKAARMEKKARESTIGKKGMRMTGCKTWHAPSAGWIETPRSFGYDLTPERLPEGMVRFFPLPTDELAFMTDKDDTPKDDSKLYTDHATPARLTHRVLSDLDAQLAELEGVLRTLEIRAVGASLLVVYEGDATRLSTAFEHADARRVAKAARTLGQSGLGDNEEEDDSEDEFDSDEEDSSEEDDDDDDGVKADARRAARASPFALRLIDFAHTWFVEGQGPDEGVLFGFETVRGLVQGRMAEVKAWMDQYEPESPSKVASGFGSDAATASEEND